MGEVGCRLLERQNLNINLPFIHSHNTVLPSGCPSRPPITFLIPKFPFCYPLIQPSQSHKTELTLVSNLLPWSFCYPFAPWFLLLD